MIPKTPDEFNEKYKDYLADRFYGMEFDNEEVLALVDEAFEEFIKVPGFKYYQIKTKFGFSRIYADEVNTNDIENKVNALYKKLKEDYDKKK